MLPLTFLGTMLVLTAGAWVVSLVLRARRAAVLCRLAKGWEMRYVGRDPFELAAKIGTQFPVPGAADLSIADLIYGSEPGRHRYLFTIQYTQGVVRTKSRRWRVGTFSEPSDAGGAQTGGTLHIAPADLPWGEQYTVLHEMITEGQPQGAAQRGDSPANV